MRKLRVLLAAISAAAVVVLTAAPASAAEVSGPTPVVSGSTPVAVDQAAQSQADRQCKGRNGVVTNFGNAIIGILQPPIMSEPEVGQPYVENGVVKAQSSLRFYNWGTSCSSMVTFNLETRVCGSWGCNWQTKDGSQSEFLWAHAGTGIIEHENSMPCRKGTNSYKAYVNYLGIVSSGAESPYEGAQGKAAGTPVSVEIDSDTTEGNVVKLTC